MVIIGKKLKPKSKIYKQLKQQPLIMKWEYKKEPKEHYRDYPISELNYLKVMGLDGWELVAVDVQFLTYYYWKRPIKETEQ